MTSLGLIETLNNEIQHETINAKFWIHFAIPYSRFQKKRNK